jgi:hypothetical protein
MIEIAVKRETESWARCIALTTLGVARFGGR